MDRVSVVWIALGILVIAMRGPLLLAPRATVALYLRIVATDARVRALALPLAAVALACLYASAEPDRMAGRALAVVGWLLAAYALVLLLVPGPWRRLARSVMEAVEDPTVLRAIGAISVVVGGLLVWLGIATAPGAAA